MAGNGAEKRLVLYNGVVLTPWQRLYGGVSVREGKIDAVFAGDPPAGLAGESGKMIDCLGNYIVPGFVDMHLHGGNGFDFATASAEEILKAASFHALSGGTTALLPAIVPAAPAQIKQAAGRISRVRSAANGPEILGVHLEGPFINPVFKGAHPERYLCRPEPHLVEDLCTSIGDDLAMVTLAPELPHGLNAVSYLNRRGVVVALGHSDASFEVVRSAAGRGLSHAVHTYSAMRGFHHRLPGALGAVLTLDELSAEMIADGIHADPAAVKLFFRVKPPDRAVLVTDAIAGCGLPDGEYRLGDQKLIVKASAARLEDGTLAGSTLTMNRAIAGAVEMASLSLEQALAAAAFNPARVLGLSHRKGSLETGKDADIVVMDGRFHIHLTVCRGRLLRGGRNEP